MYMCVNLGTGKEVGDMKYIALICLRLLLLPVFCPSCFLVVLASVRAFSSACSTLPV